MQYEQRVGNGDFSVAVNIAKGFCILRKLDFFHTFLKYEQGVGDGYLSVSVGVTVNGGLFVGKRKLAYGKVNVFSACFVGVYKLYRIYFR